MKLLYATGNPSKLEAMRGYLQGLFDVVGPEAFGVSLDVDESGKDPLENARLKAEAYFAALGRPVLAADSGLYIQGLPDEEQPGVHVRRVGDQRLTDEEMIAHYAQIAARFGGRVLARYRNAMCVIAGEGYMSSSMEERFASEPFYLVDKPHAIRKEGFPLDSLSVDAASGSYYYDLPARTSYSMFQQSAQRDFISLALTGLSEEQQARALACVEQYTRGDVTGHGAYHARRVLNAALRIAYLEPGADLAAVTLAALLHDIDDGKLTGAGTRGDTVRAKAFLIEEGYDMETIEAVTAAIETVSFKGAAVATPVRSLEGAIVQDADRLDGIGAIGIARAFAYGGAHGRPIHSPDVPPQGGMDEAAYLSANGSSIHHFYEKLLLLKDRMNTKVGRAIAQGRHGYLQGFLERFLDEWEGEA